MLDVVAVGVGECAGVAEAVAVAVAETVAVAEGVGVGAGTIAEPRSLGALSRPSITSAVT